MAPLAKKVPDPCCSVFLKWHCYFRVVDTVLIVTF